MDGGFHEVSFPLRLSLVTSGGPERRTDIVTLSTGREARNSRWYHARRRYDAGSGLRSLADLQLLIAFFEARRGALYGFRFRDPVDFRSARPGVAAIAADDQLLGTGDGTTAEFQLAKTYADAAGSFTRPITKPVAATLRVAVGGVVQEAAAYALDATTGRLRFAAGKVPAAGKAVTAGFEFDVPVRFATERIEISLAAFNAGRVPSVPLTEILP